MFQTCETQLHLSQPALTDRKLVVGLLCSGIVCRDWRHGRWLGNLLVRTRELDSLIDLEEGMMGCTSETCTAV
jgi:hypothetical protein